MSNVEVVICDTKDEDSLAKMASRARVVLNCVGPYRFHVRNALNYSLITIK